MNIFPFLSCFYIRVEIKTAKREKLYTDACTYVTLTRFVCNQGHGNKGKKTCRARLGSDDYWIFSKERLSKCLESRLIK